MLNLLAIREKFEHMSTVSGYDALYNHFPEDIQTESVFCNFKKIYPRGIGRLLATASNFTSRSGFYNAQSVEAETKLLAKYYRKKYDVIHYAYGEPYYGLLALTRKKKGTATVITHHQPVSWWQAHESLFKKYDKVDAVIALSEHDHDYFKTHIPNKTVYIPHGVDTSFFKPLAEKKKPGEPFKVIFAGRYLRDIVTLAAVVKKLSRPIQFDIVYTDKAKVFDPCLKDIMSLPNVNWYADVDQHKLLSLYQNADCCLLPLLDCTANNVLLEAMACGLPIVSTDLPAVHSYLDASMAIFARKHNVNDLCDALLLLSKDQQLKESMAAKSREKVLLNFDWNNIANQTLTLFKSLK